MEGTVYFDLVLGRFGRTEIEEEFARDWFGLFIVDGFGGFADEKRGVVVEKSAYDGGRLYAKPGCVAIATAVHEFHVLFQQQIRQMHGDIVFGTGFV